jgi:hypothetical protein
MICFASFSSSINMFFIPFLLNRNSIGIPSPLCHQPGLRGFTRRRDGKPVHNRFLRILSSQDQKSKEVIYAAEEVILVLVLIRIRGGGNLRIRILRPSLCACFQQTFDIIKFENKFENRLSFEINHTSPF